jgi:hypothetical protein
MRSGGAYKVADIGDPLLAVEETLEALGRAQSSGYRKPGA